MAQLGGRGDPLGIVQEIEIWSFRKWYMQKPESILENESNDFSGILKYERLSNPGQMIKPSVNWQKKKKKMKREFHVFFKILPFQ